MIAFFGLSAFVKQRLSDDLVTNRLVFNAIKSLAALKPTPTLIHYRATIN
jgi:hypothetical protein